MIPPTNEFHQHRHADHTARLRSEMHRHAPFSPRRTLGSWLVAAGPLARARCDSRTDASPNSDEHPETDPVSGCVPA